jgi:phosphohistidine phosphatase
MTRPITHPMLRLSLLRHAQADDPVSNQEDWDRPLTRRGMLDAKEMSRRMKVAKRKPQLILSSPAIRARQTAETFAQCFSGATLQFFEGLYLADPKQIFNCIREHGGTAAHLLVVAHNPGITEFASEISQERNIDAMPTGCIVTAEFDLTNWQDLQAATGINVELDYPQRPA